jgi:hypothetical protein
VAFSQDHRIHGVTDQSIGTRHTSQIQRLLLSVSFTWKFELSGDRLPIPA